MYIVRVPHDRTSMYIHTHTTHTHARTDATQRRHTTTTTSFPPTSTLPHPTHTSLRLRHKLSAGLREKRRDDATPHTHTTHTPQ